MASAAFAQLVEIVARLRAPDGCPWDRAQTHATLRPHLIEETAEVLEAIEQNDLPHLKEELGDLLLQPVLHAQIAAEAGAFTIEEVLEEICAKLVRRHPHVFGDAAADTPAQVLVHWDAVKRAEKEASGRAAEGLLDALPAELPALAAALKVSRKAAKVGFEWPDAAGVWDKMHEEMAELESAFAHESPERQSEEFGDLLFTAVNLARWHGINPELALRDTVQRFRSRFAHMEDAATVQGRNLESLSPQEWNSLWEGAKISTRPA